MKFVAKISILTVILTAQSSLAAEPVVPVDHFKTSDPELEVTIWAQSPMLKNPTNFDFDKDGRLYVAEGVNYRRHYERQPEGDRIVILEDSDGDGKADKSSVFVQEPFLRAPMGVAVIGNKVVVSMAPDIVVYTDLNGDRRFDPAVDKREVLLTGFNGRVHDHTVHSVTVGPDGQWYWNAGNCGAVFTDRSGKTFRIGSPYDPYYGNKSSGDLGWNPREIAGQKSDDGHVWIGGFAARMNPDGSGVHIIGHNRYLIWRRFSKRQRRSARLPHFISLGIRKCRVRLHRRETELAGGSATGPVNGNLPMAPGRSRHDAFGRRLRRRFSDRNRFCGGERAR